jgi:hypothetical protein
VAIWDDESDPLTAFDVAYRPQAGDVEVAQVLQDAFVGGRVLTVSARRSAINVAREVDATNAYAVIVVDHQNLVQGYLFPDWMNRQIERNLNSSVSTLTQALKILSQQQRDYSRSHVHEWLNFDRPPLQFCPGKPPEGPHVTFDSVPCSRHR